MKNLHFCQRCRADLFQCHPAGEDHVTSTGEGTRLLFTLSDYKESIEETPLAVFQQGIRQLDAQIECRLARISSIKHSLLEVDQSEQVSDCLALGLFNLAETPDAIAVRVSTLYKLLNERGVEKQYLTRLIQVFSTLPGAPEELVTHAFEHRWAINRFGADLSAPACLEVAALLSTIPNDSMELKIARLAAVYEGLRLAQIGRDKHVIALVATQLCRLTGSPEEIVHKSRTISEKIVGVTDNQYNHSDPLLAAAARYAMLQPLPPNWADRIKEAFLYCRERSSNEATLPIVTTLALLPGPIKANLKNGKVIAQTLNSLGIRNNTIRDGLSVLGATYNAALSEWRHNYAETSDRAAESRPSTSYDDGLGPLFTILGCATLLCLVSNNHTEGMLANGTEVDPAPYSPMDDHRWNNLNGELFDSRSIYGTGNEIASGSTSVVSESENGDNHSTVSTDSDSSPMSSGID